MKSLVILGSTGSIGTQALEVCRCDGYKVNALAAGSNIELLEKQAREFSVKAVAVFAENKANEHQKKMAEKELERQKKIIKERGLKNDLVYVSFAFGLVGTIFALWPAGHMAQVQWWYTVCTLGFGMTGYIIAIIANKKNKEHLQRYRVVVHPKLMKAGIYLSAFATFAGTIFAFAAFVYQTGGI